MTTGRILIALLAISSVCFATYNCRRKNQECKNQGTCNTDGTCTCGDGTVYEGVDCGIVLALKNDTACVEAPCQNNGQCQLQGTTTSCWCHPDYYGDVCQSKRFDIMCFGDRKILHANPYVSDPNKAFEGRIYIAGKGAETNCNFKSRNEVSAETGFNMDWTAGFALLVRDVDTTCGNITEIIEGATTTYERPIKIEYDPTIMTTLDELLRARCEYTESADRTIAGPGTVITTSVTENLFTNTSTTNVYEPLVFTASTAAGGFTGTQTLTIGTSVTFNFNIPTETGFVSVAVKTLDASDNAETNPVTFPIITERCQAAAAGSVIESFSTSDDNRTVTVIIKLFKFLQTDTVSFSGIVSICRATDTSACDPISCTASTPAANRRRRESGDEKMIQQEFNVVDDKSKLPTSTEDDQGSDCPTEQLSSVPKDCMLKTEILTVIIIMAAALIILMIACLILTCKLLRRPLKVTEMYPAEHQSSVSLPRLSPANF